MKVLVDTPVWIDFFAGRAVPHVLDLESLLKERQDICTCGVILTEVLQGIRADEDYSKTKALLENLIFLPMQKATFEAAAEIYRSLRRRGITIRKPVDCLIAAVAIGHGIPLQHNDRDFDPIVKHCGLKVI